MAIQLEFINFIVPIKTIQKKYPGGWEQCLSDHKNLIGGRVWYDDNLFRDGAMNPMDMEHLIEKWKRLGFHVHDGEDKPNKWVDVCVVEVMFGGATLPCDWIEVDNNIAFLKGASKGEVVGRDKLTANKANDLKKKNQAHKNSQNDSEPLVERKVSRQSMSDWIDTLPKDGSLKDATVTITFPRDRKK